MFEFLHLANGYSDRVIVIHGKMEEIKLPERVDIIISEPLGFLLVHEVKLNCYTKFDHSINLLLENVGNICVSQRSIS